MRADDIVSVLELIVEVRDRAAALIRCDNGREFIKSSNYQTPAQYHRRWSTGNQPQLS